MKRIGSYEAKTHLPRLLKEVESGETVVITRNGHPIAQLSPALDEASGEATVGPPAQAMGRLLASKARLGGIPLAALRDEGRRR